MPRSAQSGGDAGRESARKYMPMIFGIIVAVMFVSMGLYFPGFGPALPSTTEMWIVMFMIMVIGIAVIIYSAAKVLPKLDGNLAHGISFIIGGLILFVGVTVLDTPIHTELIQFSLLTHTLWHITELVGVVMMGIGLHKIAHG